MGALELSPQKERELVLKALELCGSKSRLSESLAYKYGSTSYINRILRGEGRLSKFTLERLLIVIEREQNRKRTRDARVVQS